MSAQLALFEALPRSLRLHSLWPEIRPYVAIERDASSSTRVRIEIRSLPRDVAAMALEMRVGCVSCGRPVHPVRVRKEPGNKRDESVGHGLYVAVACPLAVNVGCSRGRAARDEYLRIEADVQGTDARGVLS